MNFLVEGLQGSGKSTLVNKLSSIYKDYGIIQEGDYSPIELAWCAYLSEHEYQKVLEKYPSLISDIQEKTYREDNHVVLCYTKIRTSQFEFYKDLGQHEIYNNRVSYDYFRQVVLSRFKAWNTNNMIFECSIFQNIIQDMILYRCLSDEEIISFYKLLRETLKDKSYHIFYLKSSDIKGNLNIVRKERTDDKGKEVWFPLMLGYFNNSPYAKNNGLSGERELIRHFVRRQELELRILEEVFNDKCTILNAKNYPMEILNI